MKIALGEPPKAHKKKECTKKGRPARAGRAKYHTIREIPGRLAWSIAQKVRYTPSVSHDSCDTGLAGALYHRIH